MDFVKVPHGEKEFILWLCEQLKIARVYGWDAFSDNFSELFVPEIPKDYKFSLDDDWGWSDYNDYLIYKQTDEEIGNKNEDGVRDDLKLILVNFYDFYYKHRTIAEHFIHVILSTYSSSKNNKWNDPVLGFELDIKS